ncbi:hypothetical protein A6R68_11668, partial [Neotoma lepida]
LTGSSGFVTDGPGNYKYKTKCTWLIEGQPNRIMRLRFNHFATECSWDHLYVYDGDSIYAPLIAAFSGLIVPERDGNETAPEVTVTSVLTCVRIIAQAEESVRAVTAAILLSVNVLKTGKGNRVTFLIVQTTVAFLTEASVMQVT